MVDLVHSMADNDTERETTARPVDEPAALLTSEQQSKQAVRAAPEAAVKPIATVENAQDFKAGERDPLAGVKINPSLCSTLSEKLQQRSWRRPKARRYSSHAFSQPGGLRA